MINTNSIVFTYQHTCRKGVKAYIDMRAPFKSLVKNGYNGKSRIPFLGEGYYLWEENTVAAENWGHKHYDNNYNIVEFIDLEIPKDDLLDFMNRRNLRYFNELRQYYIDKRPYSQSWKIGVWIQFFKKLNKTEPGKFPFKFIRADEHLPDLNENNTTRIKMKFVDGQEYYTFLDPLYILCALDKKPWNYKKKIIK